MIPETTKKSLEERAGAETAEEIIGLLFAISVVTKRIANKLIQLEREKDGKEENHRRAKPPD